MKFLLIVVLLTGIVLVGYYFFFRKPDLVVVEENKVINVTHGIKIGSLDEIRIEGNESRD